jgi:hypothetical protein
MAEHHAVNVRVLGSSPSSGAKRESALMRVVSWLRKHDENRRFAGQVRSSWRWPTPIPAICPVPATAGQMYSDLRSQGVNVK